MSPYEREGSIELSEFVKKNLNVRNGANRTGAARLMAQENAPSAGIQRICAVLLMGLWGFNRLIGFWVLLLNAAKKIFLGVIWRAVAKVSYNVFNLLAIAAKKQTTTAFSMRAGTA